MPEVWHIPIDAYPLICQNFGMPVDFSDLSRRERQILSAVYRLRKATAAEIRSALSDPPSYTAVRTHLTLLEGKRHIKHETEGTRYVYLPVVPREEMGRRVIEGALKDFFDDSLEKVVTAFVKSDQVHLSEGDLKRLEQLIRKARKEGR